jgi:peptidyl-prolyl cis-trans isomerase A (cyclophilin A)/peptidyl-prolyl cis-trans isomerase B (cyclophilin B)
MDRRGLIFSVVIEKIKIARNAGTYIILSPLISIQGQVVITIVTNHGDIVVELFEETAPISCENFRQYVADGFFADTVFHRVIPNFMIQGGGMPEGLSSKETRAPIKNEAKNGEKNLRGTLAMARTGEVDSATSQFFINLGDNAFLDNGDRDFGYAVFGKVSGGMDVVDAIAAVSTGNKAGHQDVPLQAVIIEEVRIDG